MQSVAYNTHFIIVMKHCIIWLILYHDIKPNLSTFVILPKYLVFRYLLHTYIYLIQRAEHKLPVIDNLFNFSKMLNIHTKRT